jgi:hypothetical protein
MTDKRKRAAPTIDLKATEVPQPSPAEPDNAPKQAPPPAHEPATGAATPPPSDFIRTIVMPIAAGLAGALLGGALVWSLLPRPAGDAAQFAALQSQVDELKNRPAPRADAQAVEALRERVAKIERDMSKLSPGDASVAERLAAADSALKSLGVALTALNKRSDDAAADAALAQQRAAAAEQAAAGLREAVQNARRQASGAVGADELSAVEKRVAALEQSLKEVQARAAQSATVDKAARLALSAASLREAVQGGAPYAEQLAQARALGADERALASLATFAATGIPSERALARQLNALIPALAEAAGVDKPPSGFLERLQANAGRLVRVTPLDAPTGDSPSDVLARLDVAAAHADIASALTDIDRLPDKARRQAADWVARAVARRDTVAAARRLAAETARALQP